LPVGRCAAAPAAPGMPMLTVGGIEASLRAGDTEEPVAKAWL
jgi:hypothetical protein